MVLGNYRYGLFSHGHHNYLGGGGENAERGRMYTLKPITAKENANHVLFCSGQRRGPSWANTEQFGQF